MAGEIEIYRGDDLTIQATARDSSGAVVNLTGAVIKMTVRTSPSAANIVFQKTSADPTQIAITGAATGQFEIYIVPANTSTRECKRYWYDVEITLSSKVHTGIVSTFTILEDVTWS